MYVLRPDLFESRLAFGLAGFAVFPDIDKLVSIPGGFHSLLTLIPVAAAVVAVEWGYRGELRVAPVAVALLYSHIALDVVDGNLVPLLTPVFEWGVGFRYPSEFVFGGTWPITVRGEIISVIVTVQQGGGGGGSGIATYQFLGKYGVISAAFLALIASPIARRPESH